ncbi:unnamed protein product [Chironomus riparius]|uniref:Uncharacterized protein n=1 Tax=Chironomus riparius TaxID=315576 RepID=A0A9N9RZD1_9DIPT|nr:unnamed protein product [Chironomus riparius]
MDQSWYIPRPSLSSNSSKVQSRFYHRDSEVLEKTKDCNDCNTTHSSASSQNSSTQRAKIKKNQMQETCIDNIECDSPIKRGSRSSQGSSDSEQSIHSASSLLLTVANLENFAKIQERHHASSILDNFEKIHKQNQASIINTHPNNLFASHYNISTKELDQLSMASSTHFTMINGFGRSSMKRKSKSFICKRSRQVSVLIVTMSFLFIIGLSIAVLLIELRNREMPR